MANAYDSAYTGQHNDQYEVRIKTLEDLNLSSRLSTCETNVSEKVSKSGDTMTGALTLKGKDVVLGTNGGTSNDSGDIVFKYGDETEKARIWTEDEYTSKAGPRYRVYNSSGTNLFSGTLPLSDGTGASGTWGISITGSSTYATSYLASRGTVSGTNHAAALKTFFTNNKSSIPRNCLVTHYSSAYSNGSQCLGYWLSGYNDGPYGGFFVCHYNNARYVGISNGTYTEYDLTKTTSSSIRIKTNITDLQEDEAKQLLKINPIKFDYKEGYGEKNQFGFIAEELEEKFPYPVYCPEYDNEKEEKPLQSIDYTKFIPHLIKLVQIQDKEIKELKQEIQQLKKSIIGCDTNG